MAFVFSKVSEIRSYFIQVYILCIEKSTGLGVHSIKQATYFTISQVEIHSFKNSKKERLIHTVLTSEISSKMKFPAS